jgi:hypothetical protein
VSYRNPRIRGENIKVNIKEKEEICIEPWSMAGYYLSSITLLGSTTKVYTLAKYLFHCSFPACYLKIAENLRRVDLTAIKHSNQDSIHIPAIICNSLFSYVVRGLATGYATTV